MNITRKSIITLILSVFLVLGIMLSMSSCTFEFSWTDFLKDYIGNNGGNGNNSDGNFGGDVKDPVFFPDEDLGSLDNVSEAKRTLFSTVSIISDFNGTPAAGSGVIYKIDKQTGDAYIITNYHVIYYKGMASKIDLYLYGMQNKSYAIPATFVGGSITNDIAVLKVTGSEVLKKSHSIAATFGNSDLVRVFDTAIVVGNANGDGMSATKGIISVENESIDILGATDEVITLRVIRTDAAINQGNSGGGLYNASGELVGIVTARTSGAYVDNLGYAIPSNLVKYLADNIIDNCNGKDKTQVERPVLGVTIKASSLGVIIDPETGDILQAQKVSVDIINEDSVLKDMLQVGDIINSITIDGVKYEIIKTYQIPNLMLLARVGSVVVANATRGEQTFDISITITSEMITYLD